MIDNPPTRANQRLQLKRLAITQRLMDRVLSR